jgi:hypothetical protein
MITLFYILAGYFALKVTLMFVYDRMVVRALKDIGIKGYKEHYYLGILFTNFKSGINPLKWTIGQMGTDTQRKALKIYRDNKDHIKRKNFGKNFRDSVLSTLADKRL